MSGDNTATQQTHADVVQGQVANNTHKTQCLLSICLKIRNIAHLSQLNISLNHLSPQRFFVSQHFLCQNCKLTI